MKNSFLLFSFCLTSCIAGLAQCEIAIDTTDEFDTTRMIASLPIEIGNLIPTKNLSEDLDGKPLADEAKVMVSYAESEKRVRSFFLTLAVIEHRFLRIEKGQNVFLKLSNGQIVKLYNVPDNGELNRDIIMWQYQHTCVIPLEVYHLLKNNFVEKIRINYLQAKRTIVLDEQQQLALQEAVKCVEERLRGNGDIIKP